MYTPQRRGPSEALVMIPLASSSYAMNGSHAIADPLDIQEAGLCQEKAAGAFSFTDKHGARGLIGPPDAWRRRTFVVEAVPQRDVDQDLQRDRDSRTAGLILGDDVDSECPRDLAALVPQPHSKLFSAPAPPQSDSGDVPSAVHCRIVATPAVGRPIWEHRNETELLKGLLCVLESHQRLYSTRGWLHRNVGAGNIFLAGDQELAKHTPGFMIDFDSDVVSDLAMNAGIQNIPRCRDPQRAVSRYPETANDVDDAPRMSLGMETLQFMSRRKLAIMLDPAWDSLEPTPGDDVESFFLVLVYAVIRPLACSDRMLHTARANSLELDVVRARRAHLLKYFEEHWRAEAVPKIYRSRDDWSFLRALLSHGLRAAGNVGHWLLSEEQILISDALVNNVLIPCAPKFFKPNPRRVNRLGPPSLTVPEDPSRAESQVLTHDELINMFKEAIDEIESIAGVE